MAQFSSRPRRLSGARTLVAGSLCAAGLALFIAGEWAGVTNSWPVRFPLQLIEGRLKPISMMPESGPVAMDRAGRLLDYPGKIEVRCPEGAPVEGDGGIVLMGAKVPPDRFVEIAESVRLESIGEHPH